MTYIEARILIESLMRERRNGHTSGLVHAASKTGGIIVVPTFREKHRLNSLAITPREVVEGRLRGLNLPVYLERETILDVFQAIEREYDGQIRVLETALNRIKKLVQTPAEADKYDC